MKRLAPTEVGAKRRERRSGLDHISTQQSLQGPKLFEISLILTAVNEEK